MTEKKIKPIQNGMSFIKYLEQVFVENGEMFSRMLCENKLNIETARTISFDLKDAQGNDRRLEITLIDGDVEK